MPPLVCVGIEDASSGASGEEHFSWCEWGRPTPIVRLGTDNSLGVSGMDVFPSTLEGVWIYCFLGVSGERCLPWFEEKRTPPLVQLGTDTFPDVNGNGCLPWYEW